MIKFILKIIFKLLLTILIIVGLLFLAFNWPVSNENKEMKFHLSFSHTFARDIDLDWKQAYNEILDEFQPQKMRLAAYWTEIEKQPGEYNFEDLDWLIDETSKREIDMILEFGLKSPRWPECYIPEFYENDKIERELALLRYEKAVVERYRDNPQIIIWQVENEPFLPFGHCIEGAVDENLVDKEIEQTKQLDDSRPIMTTDSGELGLWYKAASRGDMFGTTLYRIIYKEPFGYVHYPLGPSFFKIKAWFISTFAAQDNVIVSELQAEPWGPGWWPGLSIEEQYKSMSPEKFDEIVVYTQKTGFPEAYLWGVEWWYWLKHTQNHSEMWDLAKGVVTRKE